MLIDEYRDYLENKTEHTEGCIKNYCLVLRRFLKNGYSEDDLCGAVDVLIARHSIGGNDYNPNEHGLTVSALKWLKYFLLENCAKDFYISYKRGWTSNPSKKMHIESYEITDGKVLVSYSKGFMKDIKRKEIKLSKWNYYTLIGIVNKYAYYLSDSKQPIVTVHGPASYGINYSFCGKCATCCYNLFEDKDGVKKADIANKLFEEWRKKFIGTI